MSASDYKQLLDYVTNKTEELRSSIQELEYRSEEWHIAMSKISAYVDMYTKIKDIINGRDVNV